MMVRRKRHAVAGLVLAIALVAACTPAAPSDSDKEPPGKELPSGTPPESRSPTPVPGEDPPNIVLFLTDDQTLEEMAVMPKTRRLIGDTGVTFDRAFAQYPLCCPTRATLLTGQLPHNHGVMGNEAPWGGYEAFKADNTVPMWLQDAGYRTALVGKLMNGYPVEGDPTHIDPGWDDWHVPTWGAYNYQRFRVNENGTIVRHRQYQTDWQADTMSMLAEKYSAEDVPFFIHGSFIAPHYGGPREPGDPETKTPSVADKYRDTVTEPMPDKPNRPEPGLSDKNEWLFQGSPDRLNVDGMNEVWQQRRESLKSVDDAVAQVVRKLRKLGELENTVLMFASDNGYLMGEHGLKNQKIFGYEESIRVPLLMSGPGIPKGETRNQLVSLADLPATWLELADAEPGLPPDGLSLTPFLEDATYGEDRMLLLEAGGWPKRRLKRMYHGIRTSDDRVLLRYWNGHVETYDLATDPYQLDGTTSPAEAKWRDQLLARIDELEACVGAEECNPLR